MRQPRGCTVTASQSASHTQTRKRSQARKPPATAGNTACVLYTVYVTVCMHVRRCPPSLLPLTCLSVCLPVRNAACFLCRPQVARKRGVLLLAEGSEARRATTCQVVCCRTCRLPTGYIAGWLAGSWLGSLLIFGRDKLACLLCNCWSWVSFDLGGDYLACKCSLVGNSGLTPREGSLPPCSNARRLVVLVWYRGKPTRSVNTSWQVT